MLTSCCKVEKGLKTFIQNQAKMLLLSVQTPKMWWENMCGGFYRLHRGALSSRKITQGAIQSSVQCNAYSGLRWAIHSAVDSTSPPQTLKNGNGRLCTHNTSPPPTQRNQFKSRNAYSWQMKYKNTRAPCAGECETLIPRWKAGCELLCFAAVFSRKYDGSFQL